MKRQLGFEIATTHTQTGMRKVYRFRCCECNATLDLAPGALTPESAANKASTLGWQANPHTKARTFCPKCIGPPKKTTTFNDEPAKAMVMTDKIEPIREPTVEQRVAIRSHLDKCFDDSLGCYLDSMSDQRIAELVGVPRVVVEKIREVGYGPVRTDPETLALRADIAAFRVEIDGQQKALDSLKSKAATLASKLEASLAKKMAS